MTETDQLLEWMFEEGLVEKRYRLFPYRKEWRITEKGRNISPAELEALERKHTLAGKKE